MRSAAVVLLLALLTFDVSGLGALCGEAESDDCSAHCPTDGSGGQCPPNCHSCTCCSLPKVAGGPAVTLAAPPVGRDVSWTRAARAVPSPEPADILHVPKLALA